MTHKLRTAWSYPLLLIGIEAITAGPATAASPAIEAAIRTLEKIPADTAKFETYCNLLGQMVSAPDDDSAKNEVLKHQLDAVIDSYGAEVSAAWDTVSAIEPGSEDDKVVTAAFDALEAKCP